MTPMAVDRSRPFPMLANKSLNIVVRLQEKKDEKDTGKKEQKKQKKSKEAFAVVQVPSILPRFLELPETSEVNGVKQRSFILLEEIIIAHMASLFELIDIRIVPSSASPVTPTCRSTKNPMTSWKKSRRRSKNAKPAVRCVWR